MTSHFLRGSSPRLIPQGTLPPAAPLLRRAACRNTALFPLPRTIPPQFLPGSLTPVSAGSSVPALRLLDSRLTIFPLRGDALASFAPCPLRPVHSVPPRFIPDSPQFPARLIPPSRQTAADRPARTLPPPRQQRRHESSAEVRLSPAPFSSRLTSVY